MNKKHQEIIQNNTSQSYYVKEREKIKREYQEYVEKRYGKRKIDNINVG